MVTILKSEVRQAREGIGARPRFAVTADDPDWWAFADVRDRLVEGVSLWARSPGGGGWPFATDGPWQLIVRETRLGDYDARGGDGDGDDRPRRRSLTIAEVEQRDRVSEWLAFVPEPSDRRLVVVAVTWLARGRKNVHWDKVMRQLGIKRGKGRLRQRYDRAIQAICECLNAAGS